MKLTPTLVKSIINEIKKQPLSSPVLVQQLLLYTLTILIYALSWFVSSLWWCSLVLPLLPLAVSLSLYKRFPWPWILGVASFMGFCPIYYSWSMALWVFCFVFIVLFAINYLIFRISGIKNNLVWILLWPLLYGFLDFIFSNGLNIFPFFGWNVFLLAGNQEDDFVGLLNSSFGGYFYVPFLQLLWAYFVVHLIAIIKTRLLSKHILLALLYGTISLSASMPLFLYKVKKNLNPKHVQLTTIHRNTIYNEDNTLKIKSLKEAFLKFKLTNPSTRLIVEAEGFLLLDSMHQIANLIRPLMLSNVDFLIGISGRTIQSNVCNQLIRINEFGYQTIYVKQSLTPLLEFSPTDCKTKSNAKDSLSYLICWEALFSGQDKKIKESTSSVLLIISNDIWWPAPIQKLLLRYAQLRAISTQKLVFRVSNGGFTSWITSDGSLEH